jgi:hypothetical protein
MRTPGKLRRRLEILRGAGAIADYRVFESEGQLSVQVQPGDSLIGEELRQFVLSMLGADITPEQVTVVSTFD